MGEFKGPIVEGAYYERYCGRIVGPFTPGLMRIYAELPPTELTRRVYITHTDPAEVVAELRECQKRAAIIAEDNDNDPFRLGRESAWGNAADLVAEKLGGGG